MVKGRPWQTRWSHGHRATGHQVIPGHDGGVRTVTAGTLPDGTPVIISGSRDRTVRVWRTADGVPVTPPLGLLGSVWAVAVDGNVIITAAETDIAVHQPALSRHMR